MALRIAQVAPLWENIPPENYGGTERIVYSLTEGLVKQGHQVTLFAAATAKTSASLISVYPRPLFQDHYPWTGIMYPLLNITEAFDRQNEFDIIHIHLNKASDYFSLPLARPIKNKVVFTLHFPYPTSQQRIDRHAVLSKYRELNYISISNAQRSNNTELNWVATIYNGIDIQNYQFNPTPKDYFFWLGKFNPDKGTKEAILAAKKANVKLILAGKIDQLEGVDYQYYKEIEPLVDGQQIVNVGELNDSQKNFYFGNALGFLNPIQWNEPFGLVMAESLATGTPVISFRNGAAPEIIVNGESGYLVNSIDEMAEKILTINSLNRVNCRKRVEENFTSEIMVCNYLEVYQKVLNLG